MKNSKISLKDLDIQLKRNVKHLLAQPQPEPLNLGPNIFPAQPGQLPPEAYQSQTPTVRTLPPKIVKNTLPPQYKTNTLPPKVVTTRLQPIFPPGTAPQAF